MRSLLSRGLYTMEGMSLEEVAIEGMPMRVEAGRSGNIGCRERDRERKAKIGIETERQ